MHNFYELDVPCTLLKEDVDTSSYPEFKDYHWAVWNEPSEKYLTDEAIKFIRSIGIQDQVWFNNQLQPNHVTVFRGMKDTFMDIHCDRGPTWCINYAWGSVSSEMMWWKPHDNIALDSEVCSVGSEYMKYDPAQCDLIEKSACLGPVLVRIDAPHNVVNYDANNFRWCLSIRDLANKWTWEQAVEHFRPWIRNES